MTHTYEEVLQELLSKHLFSMDLGLERIEKLLEQVGNPEKKYKVIHVAGTNGKGSTCAYLQALLTQTGKKVGIYTSPHLVDFRERIRIGNKKISEQDFITIYENIQHHATNQTFFELVTTLAFSYFAQEHVDYAIIEVGLGGRLDATNVVLPEVSIITSIGKDHTKHLGNTVEKIAYEKAGIIKEKKPLVILDTVLGKETILLEAQKKQAPIYSITTKEQTRLLQEVDITKNNLHGNFQKENLSLALQTIKLLRLPITNKQQQKAIEQVNWPGRLQYIQENVLADCAHNPDAIRVLTKELQEIKKQSPHKKISAFVGIMKDKNYETMITELATVIDDFIFAAPPLERAATVEELAKTCKKPFITTNNFAQTLQETICTLNKNELLVITGSIFTVGEAFKILQIEPFS